MCFIHIVVRTGLHLPQTGGFGCWEEHDTPATFLANALAAYNQRLCLGIPNPDELLFDTSAPHQRFAHCALVEAAGLTMTNFNKYLWLTYGQVEHLVYHVYQGLMGLKLEKGTR